MVSHQMQSFTTTIVSPWASLPVMKTVFDKETALNSLMRITDLGLTGGSRQHAIAHVCPIRELSAIIGIFRNDCETVQEQLLIRTEENLLAASQEPEQRPPSSNETPVRPARSSSSSSSSESGEESRRTLWPRPTEWARNKEEQLYRDCVIKILAVVFEDNERLSKAVSWVIEQIQLGDEAGMETYYDEWTRVNDFTKTAKYLDEILKKSLGPHYHQPRCS
jgi:hypothetical protein